MPLIQYNVDANNAIAINAANTANNSLVAISNGSQIGENFKEIQCDNQMHPKPQSEASVRKIPLTFA